MPRRALPSYAVDSPPTQPHSQSSSGTLPLLEALRTELTRSAMAETLETEVASLRAELELYQNRTRELEGMAQRRDEAVHHALAELRMAVREKVRALDAQLHSNHLTTSKELEGILEALDTPTSRRESPQSEYHTRPISLDVRQTVQEQPPEKQRRRIWKLWRKQEKHTEPEKKTTTMREPVVETRDHAHLHTPGKKKRLYKIAVRLASLIAVCVVGWQGYLFMMPTSEIGTVAGVTSSEPTPKPSQPTYAESFVELPFGATEWETYNNPDFGVRVDYPKNTSNLVQNPGGNNLWFLRRNGYLMKVTRIETDQPLDLWWSNNQSSYLDSSGRVAKSTFKGQPAYAVTSIEKTITSGTSYFIKAQTAVFQVWVKDESATTDDGKRIERMVDSLSFLNKP